MTSSVPWQERLSAGTEAVQDEVIRWYQETPEGQAYVPTMIWGTLQTEAYATVILGQVVDFLGVPDDVPAGVAKRMQRQQVLYDGEHHYDVILGEQALYTNIGGPEVMREQMDRGPARLTARTRAATPGRKWRPSVLSASGAQLARPAA
ncbi:Scr1 family TA system antitoxin-like transcriptional regulator [Streptomyces cyaneofuscatus]|uniref:Scr1 family TA system antitoxin-like transcriptional regulator n=1 Tax=Streptomyces cyaneofuscatus TaxID=66883 RepID=UPI0033B18817